MVAKPMMLNLIIKSKRITAENARHKGLKGTRSCPTITTLAGKSCQELISLSISQLDWKAGKSGTGIESFGFTLNDGHSCKAGKGICN